LVVAVVAHVSPVDVPRPLRKRQFRLSRNNVFPMWP
jgi:hypothetical protein